MIPTSSRERRWVAGACAGTVVLNAVAAAISVDSDFVDVALLVLLNSLPAVPIVLAVYALALRVGILGALLTGMVGVITTCAGLWLCYGPLQRDTASAPSAEFITIPLALIVVSGWVMAGAGTLAYLLERPERRARVGHCAACGYDLTGLAAGARCPECGRGT